MPTAHHLWAVGAKLGEGPLWDPHARRLYFLDIEGARLHRCDATGGNRRSWALPARVGFAVLTDRPEILLLGLQSGLCLFNPDSGAPPEFLLHPEGFGPATRPNDAVVDAAGRLWFGTLSLDLHPGGGTLHCLDPASGHRIVAQGWTIPNGPVALPDGSALLWADSHRRCVFRLPLDETDMPGDGQLFVRLDAEEAGLPDGMDLDTEGGLWLAVNGGGRVLRIAPDGSRREEIAVPGQSVSCCRFGGEDLATLFITTMTDGGLFAMAPGVCGLPAQRFPLSRWRAAP